MGTTPRNSPCPCGSGKKFKNCCLEKQFPSDTQQQPDDGPQEKMAVAYKAMSEKRWLDAVNIFKECLEDRSDSPRIIEAIASCYDGE